jgi:hypothetical protein
LSRWAEQAGLRSLADEHLSVPTDKGANAGLKVASLVVGMVGGADSIDDLGMLRHGGMNRVFERVYAPSTLGSFLRAFTFGHVRQLDAVASRFLTELGDRTPLVAGIADQVLVDIDDTIIEVHGYGKQGSGYGYSGVRGLNVLLATLSTGQAAPVIVAQRLRRGACGSPRGAERLVADALATVKNPKAGHGQATLFDTWRFHAFFTTSTPNTTNTVTADKTHRGHAIIEQVNADLKNSALARLPSGHFCANAAWLVLACIAFNLTRAAATLTGPNLAKATTATIRRKLISVPARIASSARRLTLHTPTSWPWETEWTELFTRVCGPPAPATT